MAWKRIISSGSNAQLNSLKVGIDSDGDVGNINVNSKVFASSSLLSSPVSSFNVVILSGSGTNAGVGEFQHTGSSAFSRVFSNALTSPALLQSVDYNGSVVDTTSVASGSLAGSGMTGGDGTTGNPAASMNIRAVTNGGITVNANDIEITKTGDSIADTAAGLEYYGLDGLDELRVKIDTSLKFSGGDLAKKAPNEAKAASGSALTGGNGISMGSFDYSTARVAIVNTASLDSATNGGIIGTLDKFYFNTGSTVLQTNSPIHFNGDSLFEARSLISDDGSDVTISAANQLTTIASDTFSVQGTATYAHESTFNVSDKFIVVNSSSAPSINDPFGFKGLNGANSSVIMGFTGSAGSTANPGRGWYMATGTATSTVMPTILGKVRLHVGSDSGNPQGLNFTAEQLSKGNTFVDTSVSNDADSLFIYTG
jgi:hypothetical protein